MCGRYSITTPVEALARLFRFSGPLPNLPPRYNVAPTQQVPIVRRASANGERELLQVRWGLVPFWAKDAKISYSLINARADGVDTKPSFREAFKRGRHCLIAADGYYEWEKKGTTKQPWRYTLKDGGPFAFAGLWERWEKAPDGVPVESCTIITTAANSLAAKLHDRMPVILADRDVQRAWLDPGLGAEEALQLCGPLAEARLSAAPANPALNKPDQDLEGPELLRPPE